MLGSRFSGQNVCYGNMRTSFGYHEGPCFKSLGHTFVMLGLRRQRQVGMFGSLASQNRKISEPPTLRSPVIKIANED